MRKRTPFVLGFLLGMLAGWPLLADMYPNSVAQACATLASWQGWSPNTTIGYRTVGFDPLELNQIDAALQNWTDHNTDVGNCSNVGFYESTSGAYVIQTSNGQSPQFPHAIATTSSNHPSGHVISATTTFYWGASHPAGGSA